MAKTIKFNLICDGNPVKTIENLQDNFSIEDVLAYYNNKLLHRWLEVRGYEKELDEVKRINSEMPFDIIKNLVKIFGIESDENEIAETISNLKHSAERKQLWEMSQKEDKELHDFMSSYQAVYQAGYEQLINEIITNPDDNDISYINFRLDAIIRDYEWVFKLDHRRLFYKFYYKAPIAVFALLMNEKTRKYYIENCYNKENDIKEFHSKFQKLTENKSLPDIIKNRLRTFRISSSHSSAGLFKESAGTRIEVEEKGKNYMILSMGAGDLVCSKGAIGESLRYSDIKDR